MMVANSNNLIVTVKPANQRTTLSALGPRRGSYSRNSNVSHTSHLSRSSSHSDGGKGPPAVEYSTLNANYSDSGDHDDDDEIRDLTSLNKMDFLMNHVDGNYGNSGSGRKPVLHL